MSEGFEKIIQIASEQFRKLLPEDKALESLSESILLLLEDRREDALASLDRGEKLVPLALV